SCSIASSSSSSSRPQPPVSGICCASSSTSNTRRVARPARQPCHERIIYGGENAMIDSIFVTGTSGERGGTPCAPEPSTDQQRISRSDPDSTPSDRHVNTRG